MSKGLFITGTGTDIGKTYVTALIVKKLQEAGLGAGYYKAALSGARSVTDSDAGFVKRFSGITQSEETMVSYLYQNAVSPHLAAKKEGNPVSLSKIKQDYDRVCEMYNYVTVEGSGGIVCPVRWDESEHILLEDVVKVLKLKALIVADAGLGAIHAVVTASEYMRNHGILAKGIILNHYIGDELQRDNLRMIEELTGVPVIACVSNGDTELSIDAGKLAGFFE